MADLLRETRRVDLQRKLKNAQARVARAERDVEDIEGELSTMAEEDAYDTIRSWRGVPNWPLLLQAEGATTSMYMLGQFMRERLGFMTSGMWGDTKQYAIHFGIASKDNPADAAAYVEKMRRNIEIILPYVTPHKPDGLRWFGINGEDTDGCALTLRLSEDLGIIKLVREVHTTVTDELSFETLGEALFHLQEKHPSHDAFEWLPSPADAPGGTGEALRYALTAFFEGCRTAGIPIEQAGFGSSPLLPDENAAA